MVRIIYQGDSSEIKLRVHSDPRETYDEAADQARQDLIDLVHAELKAFNVKVKEIKSCNESLATIKVLAKKHNSDTLNSHIKLIGDRLAQFEKELNGESDIKGIFENEDLFIYNVSPLLYMARQSSPFTPNQIVTLNEARKTLSEMDAKITGFLEKEWNAFKELVGQEDLSLF